VCFDCNSFDLDEHRVPQEGLRAIARLLQTKSQKLYVQLKGLNLLSRRTDRLLYGTLARTWTRGFTLEGCKVRDSTVTAKALTKSKVAELCIANVHDNEAVQTLFLTTLGNRLANMAALKELDCDFTDSDDLSTTTKSIESESSRAVAVVNGAAYCRNLKRLKLRFNCYTDSLDRALVKCLTMNSCLEQVELYCRFPEGSVHNKSAPLLLQAMNTTYSLLNIGLYSHSTLAAVDPVHDAWDSDVRKSLETFALLNQSGRCYLANDAANTKAGVLVLEKVVGNLHCLFVHLRENPLLCCR
jgi:hypothetical protein